MCVRVWTLDWFVSVTTSKQLRKEECFASDWLFPWRQVHSNKCHLISNGDVFPQQSSIHLRPDRLTPVQLCLLSKHLWHLQCIISFGSTEGQRGGMHGVTFYRVGVWRHCAAGGEQLGVVRDGQKQPRHNSLSVHHNLWQIVLHYAVYMH